MTTREPTALGGTVIRRASIVIGIVILGGCGHRDRIAPCSASEGAIRSYAPLRGDSPDGQAYRAIPILSGCGPLRPVNVASHGDIVVPARSIEADIRRRGRGRGGLAP